MKNLRESGPIYHSISVSFSRMRRGHLSQKRNIMVDLRTETTATTLLSRKYKKIELKFKFKKILFSIETRSLVATCYVFWWRHWLEFVGIVYKEEEKNVMWMLLGVINFRIRSLHDVLVQFPLIICWGFVQNLCWSRFFQIIFVWVFG